MIMRAKYFSNDDLSTGYCLQRAEEVIRDFVPGTTIKEVNDILECCNIVSFFDNKLYLVNWDEKTIGKYSQIVKMLKREIGQFFHDVTGEKLNVLYEQTESIFKDDFVMSLSRYKVIDRISNEQFSCFLDSNHSAMSIVLQNKDIVNKFGQVIVDKIIEDVSFAELVIRHYYEKKDSVQRRKSYMPTELQKNQQETIIKNYVEWREANINYLQLISEQKKAGDCPIDDRIRLKAQKKVKAFWKEHFNNNKGGLKFGVEIKFDDQKKIIDEKYDDNEMVEYLSYSKKWISENLDYPTLLNNFIYLFNYVDKHNRCQFLSNPNYLGVIERLVGLHGNNEYRTGIGYESIKMKSSLQMLAYQKELQNHNIEIEYLFKWFFEEYLKLEFDVENYMYCAPSHETNVLERILLMASQLDAVLKQYKLYIENGEIDRELFEFSSSISKIVDAPSMIEKKYYYPIGDVMEKKLNYLFSNQCMLSYPNKTGSKYDCFAKILVHEDVKKTDYSEPYHDDLKWLIDKGVIFEDDNYFLSIDPTLLDLLFDLHFNGCVVYSYCNERQKELIKKMIENKEVEVESYLFTRQEKDYLDYMLNVQQYTNGPEIRNKYVHGNCSLDPVTHQKDYIELLKIMTLIVIKINEEFCLKFPSENSIDILID